MVARAAAAIIFTLVLAGCDMLPESVVGHRSPAVRYRLSAIVNTPEGVRSGSSVIQVQWSSGGRAWGPMQGGSITQQGDAVEVDLPRGCKLFVLLTAPVDNYDWFGWALQAAYRNASDPTGESHDVRPFPRRYKNNSGEFVDNWSYFVTFGDPLDPKSMIRVDPDNLAATFGKGYAMKGMTVQITDAPVTRGIERTLPWVKTADWPIHKNAQTPLADLPIWGLVVQPSFSREQ